MCWVRFWDCRCEHVTVPGVCRRRGGAERTGDVGSSALLQTQGQGLGVHRRSPGWWGALTDLPRSFPSPGATELGGPSRTWPDCTVLGENLGEVLACRPGSFFLCPYPLLELPRALVPSNHRQRVSSHRNRSPSSGGQMSTRRGLPGLVAASLTSLPLLSHSLLCVSKPPGPSSDRDVSAWTRTHHMTSS